jgi:hypothetical protein
MRSFTDPDTGSPNTYGAANTAIPIKAPAMLSMIDSDFVPRNMKLSPEVARFNLTAIGRGISAS